FPEKSFRCFFFQRRGRVALGTAGGTPALQRAHARRKCPKNRLTANYRCTYDDSNMGYQALLFCPDEKTARTLTEVLGELEFSVEPCTETFAAVKRLMGEHFDA